MPFHVGIKALPLLPEALAHPECRAVHAYPGDRTIFLGEVEAAAVATDASARGEEALG